MADLTEKAKDYLDARRGERVTLGELAGALGASPFHLQRRFKQAYGVSPRGYQDAHRVQAVEHALREGQRIRFDTFATPLGTALVAVTAKGVCAVKLLGDAPALERLLAQEFPAAELEREPLHELRERIRAFIAGGASLARVPLDIRGTVFQRRVWEALRRIPRGETRTYGHIARALGAPGAARAVGSACGANPVALLVPCHRAIRNDGGLGGYAWGLGTKRRLLEIERRRRK